MKLTALEIKQQQFEKTMRGYEPGEVRSFLNIVSSEWEHMVSKIQDLETHIDKLHAKLEHYERIESALHETLQTAKENTKQKVEAARKEAELILEKAETETKTIVREASIERQQIRQSILHLLNRRQEIIGGIRSYLELAQESLQRFGNDEASLFTIPVEETDYSGLKTDDPKHTEKRQSQKPDKKSDSAPAGAGTQNLDEILDELD